MAWLSPSGSPPRAASTDDLVARVLAGERRAIEELYRREADAVYRFALAMSGNAAWAADALQEAFMVLLAGQAHWDTARSRAGGLGAYLCGIARHQLLAQHRSAVRADEWDESLEANERADPDADPLARQLRVESLDALHAALRQLPWPQREAVVLVDLQERDYEQAAQIAGVSANTLRTRLFRGRRRLQETLVAGSPRPARPHAEGTP